jgi:AbrB family looped-hinge helix DNA binding protein
VKPLNSRGSKPVFLTVLAITCVPVSHRTKVLQVVLLYMSKSTRITEKGQATIPKEIREKYDLEPGDEVIWVDTEDGIVVKKRTSTSGRGMLVPDDISDETREEVAEELTERVRDRRDRNYEDV